MENKKTIIITRLIIKFIQLSKKIIKNTKRILKDQCHQKQEKEFLIRAKLITIICRMVIALTLLIKIMERGNIC